jgi:Mannosyltransferase (PIG-V)
MSGAPPPRWARLVDFVCLGLLILAVVIAIFGGLRMRVAGFRLALTSPYRTLIWAVVLGVVRHLFAPGTPVYRDLPARIARGWRTPAARTAASALAGTRLPILFVGYLAIFTIGYREGGAPWKIVEDNEFQNLQARWDAGWYLTVAIDGYRYLPDRPVDQQNIVFFPAYPMLTRFAARLLGGAPTAFALAGTLISLGAFFGALIYLYRFAREVLNDDESARGAVWLLAAFPFALFYGAIYTESLFLLGAVATFYHFRHRAYMRAGAWGLLVGLTRPPGCLVSVPLAVLAIEPWLPSWLAGGPARDRATPDVRRLVAALASAAMPGVGMLLFSAFIWTLTGDPLTWEKGHAAWGREYTGLGVLVTQRYEWLTKAGGLYEYSSHNPTDLLNALGVIFVLAAAWPVARRLGLAYAVFILVNMLPPLAIGGLLSAGRFASVLFPAFVWFAGAIPNRHRPAWLLGFMAIQTLDATMFYTWRPLY